MMHDELYEKGLDLRRSMFGRAGAEDQVETTTDFNEKIQDVVTRYCFGDIWQREGLDLRTRSFVTLAMLVALGRPHEIRIHLRGAISNGIATEEIRELMIHSFLYCGLPAAIDGLTAFEELLAEADAESDDE